MAGWDAVPWFVGGGAEHSPEVARLLAYVASVGSEGIIGINDLQVRAQDVPGGTVRVMPGACLIRNRGAGGAYQSYACRLPTAETAPAIAPTTSTAGRSDLVIARVENPNVAGEAWQQPVDQRVGPYIFTRVISGVASTVTNVRQVAGHANDSALTLARIDLPASTGTVLQSHITPLRHMAMPRTKHELFARAITAGTTETQTVTAIAGEQWPNAATSGWRVDVPEWATRVRLRGEWAQVKIPPGNVTGLLWARIGADSVASHLDTQTVGYDTPGSTQYQRSTFVAADDLFVPAALRGTNQAVYLKARNTAIFSGGNAARLVVDGSSAVTLSLDFEENAAEDAT